MLRVDGKNVAAHRVAWLLTHGAWPAGVLCHDCPGGDNPACVRPEHMTLADQRFNMADAARKGRMARGPRLSQSKLNPMAATVIRFLATSGRSGRELALAHGVSHEIIRRVLSGTHWTARAD